MGEGLRPGTLLRRLSRRVRLIFGNESLQRDIDDELAFHVEMEIEENVRRGMGPTEARRRALIAFGGVDRTVERGRDAYGGRRLQDFVRAHGLAARTLARRPLATGAIVATLALGVGTVTALFSLVDGVLLRPLPFHEPERIDLLGMRQPNGAPGLGPISPLDFGDFRARTRSYADLAAYSPGEATVAGRGELTLRVGHALATANLFDLLGQVPAAGRLFVPTDGERGAERVAVLSHGLWIRAYGGDPGIVGSSQIVDGQPATVVGVLGPGLAVPQQADVWTNYTFGFTIGARQARWLHAIGRFAPGATREDARAELEAVARALEQEYPGTNSGWGVAFEALPDAVVGSVRPALLLLFGATALVLLIAVSNVAGLLLTHGHAREREFALRRTLGAGRGHITGQLLAEATVLTAWAAPLALGLATLLVVAVARLGPADLPRLDEVGVDWRSLLFLVAAAFSVVGVLTLAPSGVLRREDERTGLGGSSVGPDARAARVASGLVGAQVAISTVLLIATGLFTVSFRNLVRQDAGFEPARVVALGLTPPAARYSTVDAISSFYEEVRRTVAEIPGVDAASLASSVPFGALDDQRLPYTVVGRAIGAEEDPPTAVYRKVGEGFFESLSIPLLTGRPIRAEDRADQPGVAVVDEALASMTWPDEDPIGRRLSIRAGNFGARAAIGVDEVEVVGVVESVRYRSPDAEAEPTIYLSHQQAVFPTTQLVVRTGAGSESIVPAVRAAIRRLDPDFPLFEAVLLQELFDGSVAGRRFAMLVLFAFSTSALALACVGLFGMIAATVTRRVGEIAVRQALGAHPRDVLGLVVRRGMVVVAVSASVGVAAAVGASWWVGSVLYGVSPTDPRTILGSVGGVLLVGLFACGLPALRALRLSPVIALRR